ncbi:acyl-CoA dehydrogenase family protein [Mycobacterium sp. NPDC049093]
MDRADLPPAAPATSTRQAHPDRVRTAPHTSRNRGLKFTPRESTEPGAVPSDSVAVQTQIAEAALKIDTARLHSIAIVDKLDAAANTSGTIEDAVRAWMRASSGYAVQQVLDAIQLLLSVHGSAAFAESNPLQRIWRDANVAGRHAGLNAAVGYEVLGKALLAVPEQITPMV